MHLLHELATQQVRFTHTENSTRKYNCALELTGLLNQLYVHDTELGATWAVVLAGLWAGLTGRTMGLAGPK